MNKLNVGDYVRTKNGTIAKIKSLFEKEDYIFLDVNNYICGKQNIIKSSPNIIDLIEENDYIRIMTDTDFRRVYSSYGKLVIYRNEEIPIENFSNKFIGEIVTHEQFENISYKVGE